MIFLSMQPASGYFKWQLEVQIHNLNRLGMLEGNEYHILGFLTEEQDQPNWSDLESENVKVFFYKDDKGKCAHLIKQFNYQPLLRPWMASLHFRKNRDLSNEAIFYMDSDIVFTKKLDFTPFLQDAVSYLSLTGNRKTGYNYISYSYFNNKIQSDDVADNKKDIIQNSNIIKNLTNLCGVSEEMFREQELNIGGAQYLLKNINYKFWDDVLDGCMMIRLYLSNMNQRYFKGDTPQEKENKGFQSWCADMWSVLFNIWKNGGQTQCPKELDFAWKNTKLEELDECYIYHDAGHHEITEDGIHYYLFNKRKLDYLEEKITPFEDDLNDVSKIHSVSFYISEIKNTNKNKKHNG